MGIIHATFAPSSCETRLPVNGNFPSGPQKPVTDNRTSQELVDAVI